MIVTQANVLIFARVCFSLGKGEIIIISEEVFLQNVRSIACSRSDLRNAAEHSTQQQ